MRVTLQRLANLAGMDDVTCEAIMRVTLQSLANLAVAVGGARNLAQQLMRSTRSDLRHMRRRAHNVLHLGRKLPIITTYNGELFGAY